jgi:hypothetical protein
LCRVDHRVDFQRGGHLDRRAVGDLLRQQALKERLALRA